ncbi:energy-coupling factor transporter transmembrane component T family protein [Arthrobacter sp. B1I2]|uniref:energy-coupling factor transporter transmembrane component T family protein n=1 Tax=Arthrobacter sp. B1I2 TaxID=3042263 RepID=UPI00278A8CA5|nr:energy-coupling factor transporter transmembrane component T [Arthrobacter sp. B1I2]MDQ0732487.1 energy-coupling factor transport system permease protein [Arthrobacter sp. B1I2]
MAASPAGRTAEPARRERLNPLTSLAAAVATAAITTAAGSWLLSLAVVAACLGLSMAGGTARRVLPAAAAVLVPLGLSLLWLHGLFFPEGRTVLAEWGPARITAEGLDFAGQRILQLAAVVLALLLFSFSVRVPDLVAALSARGVQGRFAFVLASTLTLLPAIAARAQRIRQAQESRGLVVSRSLVSRAGAFRLQAVPLVLSLIDDAGTRAAALEARGLSNTGPRTSYREVADSALQRATRVVLVLSALAAVVLRVAGAGG